MNKICNAAKRRTLVSALVLVIGIGAASAAGGGKLIFNGKVASTDVRTVNGSAYVKLSDMATALGMVVVKRGDGFELVKKGGANQVDGVLQGKIGDTLFDGQWRFTVLSIQTPESYVVKTPSIREILRGTDNISNDEKTGTLRAATGYKLVVIQCRVTNGQKSPQTFWLGKDAVKNALAGRDGQSHAPFGYDLEGAPTQSKTLLPGAAALFPILFSVPEATEPKDLVFTLRNNDFSSNGKSSDVRVSLKTP
ncbi:MAG: hypothetical protein V4671_15020 [Armatimonadota bacterium]